MQFPHLPPPPLDESRQMSTPQKITLAGAAALCFCMHFTCATTLSLPPSYCTQKLSWRETISHACVGKRTLVSRRPLRTAEMCSGFPPSPSTDAGNNIRLLFSFSFHVIAWENEKKGRYVRAYVTAWPWGWKLDMQPDDRLRGDEHVSLTDKHDMRNN